MFVCLVIVTALKFENETGLTKSNISSLTLRICQFSMMFTFGFVQITKSGLSPQLRVRYEYL